MISDERLAELADPRAWRSPNPERTEMAKEIIARRTAMREMVGALTEIEGSNNPERIQRYARAARAKAKEIEI